MTAGLGHGAAFRMFHDVVVVTTPTAAVADSLKRLLPSFVVPLDTEPPTELYHLRQSAGNWTVAPHGLASQTFATLQHSLEAQEHLVVTRLLALDTDVAHLHAAGAVGAGGGLVVLGESGAGKSSIALHWSVSGVPVLGDDVVFVGDGGVALPFKRFFTVPCDRLDRYDVERDPFLDAFADPDEAWYDPRTGGAWAEASPIRLVAHVTRAATDRIQVEPLDGPRTAHLLVSSVMETGMRPDRCFDRMLCIASEARAVEVTFGDSAEAADALISLI